MAITIALAVGSEQERLLVQQVLTEVRSPEFVTEEFMSPDDLFRLISTSSPAVVILSALFAGSATPSLVERLTSSPFVQVIVLLPQEDFSLARQFIRAGAIDTVPLSQIASELKDTERMEARLLEL